MDNKRNKMRRVIEASQAVAEGVKLCNPDVIPMYPITPQTHIVERLAEFINDGELDSEMVHVESEHSAISAAIGAQATGVRTFTATASQGLALMHEILFIASGMRLPIVMAVANRALSAPINIWNDHQDSISERDTGWIQIYAESSQEALDSIIQAYKIAEDKNVLLPVMVCIDGFTLSHVFEPADLPTKSKVTQFLPKYKPIHAFLDPRKPMTQGPVGFPDTFMQFKKDQQDAMLDSIKIIKKVNSEFKKKFGRTYGDGLIEMYKMNNADYAIMCMGTICGTSRTVIDEMRKEGKKVGMIKVRTYRPFPVEALVNATKKLKGIAVIDRDVSLGYEGALFTDVKSALFSENKNTSIKGFIAGLGGKDVKPEHLKKALEKTIKGNSKDVEWLM